MSSEEASTIYNQYNTNVIGEYSLVDLILVFDTPLIGEGLVTVVLLCIKQEGTKPRCKVGAHYN